MATISETSEGPQCRICLVSTHDTTNFLSPCKCKGSQEFIHKKCLEEWQKMLLSKQAKDNLHTASTCQICKSGFTYKTWTLTRYRLWLKITSNDFLIAALIVTLLIFSPQLVCFLMGVFSFCWVCLHIRGIKPIVYENSEGETKFAIIRMGKHVAGIKSGTLLSATNRITRGMFRDSHVLIYQHGDGMLTKGVIINKPLGSILSNFLATENIESSQGPISPAFGGPVSLRDAQYLHNIPNVPLAEEIVPGIYLGGNLDLEGIRTETSDHRVLMLFGHASWIPGQLEGEIRCGSWTFAEATTLNVFPSREEDANTEADE
mmetsp:Transcript_21240/g.24059  ORF Transcript_21240/g.24059 Transcript_21240/m.24059 type:complete len:318 (-) Transcript_21240:184-1137(-)